MSAYSIRAACLSCPEGAGGEGGDPTLTFPNLLAIDEAKSIEIAAIMLVVKKSDPKLSSLRLNFSWKKNVAQELDTFVNSHDYRGWGKSYREASPDANESRANNKQRFITIILLSGLISGSNDRIVDFFGFRDWSLSASSGAVSGSEVGAGSGCFFSASQALLSARARRSLMTPRAEYPQNTAL